ncbi:MAG: ornithine cyclodeaminase family protein [Rhodospirillales bacterium]
MTLILSNEEIDKILTMPDCIEVLEDAYAEYAAGRGVVRARTDTLAPTAMEGAVYGLKSADGIAPKYKTAAVRINSDIVTSPVINGIPRRVKVPLAPGNRWVGLVLLFDTDTGEPKAIFPDGIMQRMRVGATSGLGAKYLARKNSKVVGMIGSGFQAGSQLMAVCAVRDIETVRVFSPSKENREAFCREWGERMNVALQPVDSAEKAMKGADIGLCSSSALDYIFFENMIEPGMHFTSIKLPEIEPKAALKADLLFIHNYEGKQPLLSTDDVEVPEKVRGREDDVKAAIDFKTRPTLFDLISGREKGRTSDDQTTCFLNNTGTGYQFAAVGAVVVKKARELGVGNELPTDWFTEDVHP